METPVNGPYDLKALRDLAARDTAVAVREIDLGRLTPDDWQQTQLESFVDGARIIRRATFYAAARVGSRVRVEAWICPSSADAMEALIEGLANNQLAQLIPGPKDLGTASFMHPDFAPPALFLTTRNLYAAISSIGTVRESLFSLATKLSSLGSETSGRERES